MSGVGGAAASGPRGHDPREHADGAFPLEAYLEEGRTRVDEALARVVERLGAAVAPELGPPIRHAVLTGGKRLRPILCVSAYRAVRNGAGDLPPAIWELAAALELIHAYSLMHDDLPCMDDAAIRRGEPTPHRFYGEERTSRAAAALIPGAALEAWDSAAALGLGDPVRRELVATLARAAGGGGMVGGQLLDLEAEDAELSSAELDDLHARKTGALLAASLRMGGLAAEAAPPVLGALDEYGRAVGLAFQITDDVLDATASSAELGKEPSDEVRGKSTYVELHGVEEARRRARGAVRRGSRALREAGVRGEALAALAEYVVNRSR